MRRSLIENLRAMWAAIVQEVGSLLAEFLNFRDPSAQIDQQLKLLLGRGDLPLDLYFQYKEKLQRGQLGSGDLAVLRQKTLLSQPAESGFPFRSRNWLTGQNLDRLYLYRGQLKDALDEIEKLDVQLDRALRMSGEQAEAARAAAQAAVQASPPDDDLARMHLRRRERLLHHRQRFQERQESLHDTLQRIRLILDELNAYEMELKVLDSEEYLLQLESSIRENYLLN